MKGQEETDEQQKLTPSMLLKLTKHIAVQEIGRVGQPLLWK